MRIVPTVRVSDGSGGAIVINEADFDPVVHERLGEPPGRASPDPAAQEPAPRRSAKGVAGTSTRRRKGRGARGAGA